MLCTNCDRENNDFSFCRSCGTKHSPSDLDLLDKSLHKLDWQFCLKRGIKLTAVGEFYNAIEYLDLAVKLNPKEPSVYNARGLCKQKIMFCPEFRFKYQEALEDFYKAQQLNRKNIETLFNIGHVQFKLGDFWEAFGAYDEILDQQPLNINALNGAGTSKFHLGEYEDAEELISKHIKIAPDNRTVLCTYARILIGLYEFKKGIIILKKLVGLNYGFAKKILNNITPVQYLIVAEAGNKGFVLAFRDNEDEANKCHKTAYNAIEEHLYDKKFFLTIKVKHIAEYSVKENPAYLSDITLDAQSNDFSVSVIRINVMTFNLKTFIKNSKKQAKFNKRKIEEVFIKTSDLVNYTIS
jgi:tetratricopeptide (TPR) repeat protein